MQPIPYRKATTHIAMGLVLPPTYINPRVGVRLALIALSVALPFTAQLNSTAIPIWPQNGRVPSELDRQCVFLSPAGHTLIIRVPPNSEYAKSGQPLLLRYELHNRIDPAITVVVQRNEAGTYSYEYTVGNGNKAVDSIRTWTLITTAERDKTSLAAPAGWFGSVTFRAAGNQSELPKEPPGHSLLWLTDDPGLRIGAATRKGGFRVISECAPGFTTALFSAGEVVNLDQELPEEVFAQLKMYRISVLGREISDLTLGPMFRPDATDAQMAQNFISGIGRMLERAELAPQSPFVASILSALRSGGKERVSVPASTPKEQEIAAAVRLSLPKLQINQSRR